MLQFYAPILSVCVQAQSPETRFHNDFTIYKM